MKKKWQQLKPGDRITIDMYDGRILSGTVVALENTVAGTKVKAQSASLLITVNLDQIKKEN